jgi:hypothetical protein
MIKEIRFGAWGVSNQEQKKPYAEQIETAYRTVEADNQTDADNYMAVKYHNVTQSAGRNNYRITVNKCHGKQKVANGCTEFFYIICRHKE